MGAVGVGAPARPAGENLAVFYDRLHPGSDLRVVAAEPLPLEAE